MDPSPSIGQIDAEASVQRRIWLVSRLAWWGMGAVLALAGAGLFGDGPLAEAEEASSDTSLRVVYDRFQRADASSPFVLRAPRQAADGSVTVCLDRRFTEEWQVGRFEPEPVRQEARGEEVCRVILTAPGAPAPAEMRFWAKPRVGGLRDGRVRLADGGGVRVRALVWP